MKLRSRRQTNCVGIHSAKKQELNFSSSPSHRLQSTYYPLAKPSSSDSRQQQLMEEAQQVEQQAGLAASDTTLLDLPTEVLGFILIKAVVSEVIDMKLAKSVWKEKVDLVIGRLSSVCLKWSSILTSDYVQNAVHSILDNTAEKKIRLEILDQYVIRDKVMEVARVNDEIFIITRPDDVNCVCSVYDRNNMAQARDIIQLPDFRRTWGMMGCSLSSCVYVGRVDQNEDSQTVLRVSKDEDHQFNLATWVPNLKAKISLLSVLTNGTLVIVSWKTDHYPQLAKIYDIKGSMQQEINLSHGFNLVKGVVEGSNGNLVLIAFDDMASFVKLTEVTISEGMVIRRRQSTVSSNLGEITDVGGRILLTNFLNEIKLFDAELHLVYNLRPRFHGKESSCPCLVSYDKETNEVIHLSYFLDDECSKVTIFHFTET